jgi:hypothetical protein
MKKSNRTTPLKIGVFLENKTKKSLGLSYNINKAISLRERAELKYYAIQTFNSYTQ